MKFLTKLEWKATDIIENLVKVYGETTPMKTIIYEWIKRFKEGRESLKDDDRSGKPTTSINGENVAKVQEILDQDRRASLHMIARRVNISYGSVQAIVTDRLGLSKFSARWVPRALRAEHITARLDDILHFLNKFDADAQDGDIA